MGSLTEEITKIQEELKHFKTTQLTNNDSYIYYRYNWQINENTPAGTYTSREYRVTFYPNQQGQDYIVNFYLTDRFPGQVLNYCTTSLTNKNKATFMITADATYHRFEAFLTCYSTISGELKVEMVNQY